MSLQEGQKKERRERITEKERERREKTKTNKVREWKNRLRNTAAERETESDRQISV